MDSKLDLTRSVYSEKISKVLVRLLDSLQKQKIPTDNQLQQAQKILDLLAKQYQQHEDIGEGLYKLYLAQSIIHFFNEDFDKANTFLNEAKSYSVNSDTKLVEAKINKSIDYFQSQEEIKRQNEKLNIESTMNAAKSESVNTIIKGLLLIALSLGITIVSFRSTSEGGKFTIFWGFGIWGAILVAKGIYAYSNPVTHLSNSFKSNHPEYKDAKTRGLVSVVIGLTVILVLSYALVNMFAPSLANQIEAGGDQTTTYQKNFTDSCTKAGGDTGRCGCVAMYLTNHYNSDQLAGFDKQYSQTGSLPPELSNVINTSGC